MSLASVRQVLMDTFQQLMPYGYTKSEITFSLVKQEKEICLTLSTRVYQNLKRTLKQGDGIFIEIKRYFGKTSRGRNCQIIIKEKNKNDLLGITHLSGRLVNSLKQELEKQREAEAAREAERVRLCKLEEREKKKKLEESMINGEEAKQAKKTIKEKVLLEIFTPQEIKKVFTELTYDVCEKMFYFRFSSMKLRSAKKGKDSQSE